MTDTCVWYQGGRRGADNERGTGRVAAGQVVAALLRSDKAEKCGKRVRDRRVYCTPRMGGRLFGDLHAQAREVQVRFEGALPAR